VAAGAVLSAPPGIRDPNPGCAVQSPPCHDHPTRTHHVSVATALAFAAMFSCVQVHDAEVAAQRAVPTGGWSVPPAAMVAALGASDAAAGGAHAPMDRFGAPHRGDP
jgi:hypothetical protein